MVDPLASARAIQIPEYRGISSTTEKAVVSFNQRAESLRMQLELSGRVERNELLAELVKLWSCREALAERMATELASVAADAEATMKEIDGDTRQRFATLGITVEGMAGASICPAAAERQLTQLFYRFDLQYRKATERSRDAKDQLQGAKSQVGRSQRGVKQIEELRTARCLAVAAVT